MYCRVSPFSCTCNSETISKTTQWLNFFIVTKRISEWHHFCKWKFLYIVNSAGGSFCWNYVTDILYSNYAGGNVCCNYASLQVVLSVTFMLVDLSVAIMHVTVSVDIIQLEVSAALMQVTVSTSNMWVTIFIVVMQVWVFVATMQVVLSAVHDCFYCKMQVTVSVIAM